MRLAPSSHISIQWPRRARYGTAPAIRGVTVMSIGESLFHTLMLSLVVCSGGQPRPGTKMIDRRGTRVGYVHSATTPSGYLVI